MSIAGWCWVVVRQVSCRYIYGVVWLCMGAPYWANLGPSGQWSDGHRQCQHSLTQVATQLTHPGCCFTNHLLTIFFQIWLYSFHFNTNPLLMSTLASFHRSCSAHIGFSIAKFDFNGISILVFFIRRNAEFSLLSSWVVSSTGQLVRRLQVSLLAVTHEVQRTWVEQLCTAIWQTLECRGTSHHVPIMIQPGGWGAEQQLAGLQGAWMETRIACVG